MPGSLFKLRLDGSLVECSDGILDAGEKIPLSFPIRGATRRLMWRCVRRPASRGSSVPGSRSRDGAYVDVDNGRVARLASCCRLQRPHRGGTLKGTVRYAHPAAVTAQLTSRAWRSAMPAAACGDGIGGKFDIEAAQRAMNGMCARQQTGARERYSGNRCTRRAGQQLIAEGDSGARRPA